jgi:hypothetical protein
VFVSLGEDYFYEISENLQPLDLSWCNNFLSPYKLRCCFFDTYDSITQKIVSNVRGHIVTQEAFYSHASDSALSVASTSTQSDGGGFSLEQRKIEAFAKLRNLSKNKKFSFLLNRIFVEKVTITTEKKLFGFIPWGETTTTHYVQRQNPQVDASIQARGTQVTPLMELMDTDFNRPLGEEEIQDFLNLLVIAGADCNVVSADVYSMPPLCFAAQHNFLTSIEHLLAAGANINATDTEGKTPLYHAAQWGHLEIVNRLIAAGADLDQACKKGESPFYIAAYYGHVKTV